MITDLTWIPDIQIWWLCLLTLYLWTVTSSIKGTFIRYSWACIRWSLIRVTSYKYFCLSFGFDSSEEVTICRHKRKTLCTVVVGTCNSWWHPSLFTHFSRLWRNGWQTFSPELLGQLVPFACLIFNVLMADLEQFLIT